MGLGSQQVCDSGKWRAGAGVGRRAVQSVWLWVSGSLTVCGCHYVFVIICSFVCVCVCVIHLLRHGIYHDIYKVI